MSKQLGIYFGSSARHDFQNLAPYPKQEKPKQNTHEHVCGSSVQEFTAPNETLNELFTHQTNPTHMIHTPNEKRNFP